MRVQIKEEDDFLRLEDEFVDIAPGAAHTLSLMLDLAACNVTGDVHGEADPTSATCSIPLRTSGTGSSDPRVYSGELALRVEITDVPGVAHW